MDEQLLAEIPSSVLITLIESENRRSLIWFFMKALTSFINVLLCICVIPKTRIRNSRFSCPTN